MSLDGGKGRREGHNQYGDNQLKLRLNAILTAYEAERGHWTFWQAPPPQYDASYFRLRRFITLDAPRFIIEKEYDLLSKRLVRMEMARLGATMQ